MWVSGLRFKRRSGGSPKRSSTGVSKGSTRICRRFGGIPVKGLKGLSRGPRRMYVGMYSTSGGIGSRVEG